MSVVRLSITSGTSTAFGNANDAPHGMSPERLKVLNPSSTLR